MEAFRQKHLGTNSQFQQFLADTLPPVEVYTAAAAGQQGGVEDEVGVKEDGELLGEEELLEDEELDLGYYPDGVKRTLTDEQVAMFRYSEEQAIIRKPIPSHPILSHPTPSYPTPYIPSPTLTYSLT